MSKYVDSRVIINQSVVKQLQEVSIMALEQTGEYVLGEVVEAQVMPFDKGTLQNESTYVDRSQSKQGSVKIVSAEPYARRLYFHPEYNFQTINNHNAKGKWLEDWAEGGKHEEEIKKYFAHLFKIYGGI